MLCIFRLDELIETFLEDNDPDSTLDVGTDMRKINYCFICMKVLLFNIDGSAGGTENNLKIYVVESFKRNAIQLRGTGKG